MWVLHAESLSAQSFQEFLDARTELQGHPLTSRPVAIAHFSTLGPGPHQPGLEGRHGLGEVICRRPSAVPRGGDDAEDQRKAVGTEEADVTNGQSGPRRRLGIRDLANAAAQNF